MADTASRQPLLMRRAETKRNQAPPLDPELEALRAAHHPPPFSDDFHEKGGPILQIAAVRVSFGDGIKEVRTPPEP
jgi:hypothetical protein